MYEFIRDHALRNVWCTPDQDNQVIIAPARITPINGAVKDFKNMWRNTPLPTATDRYHVYRIGQIFPESLGLPAREKVWVKISDACNEQKLICDIYVESGIQLPRFATWYTRTSDNDLLIAVQKNDNIDFNFNEDQIFIRFYTNAYYASLRADAVEDFIHVQGVKANGTADVIALQNAYNTYAAKPGHTYCFVNGYKVSEIDMLSFKSGDVGEFIYDSSIDLVVDFAIRDLLAFESTLDLKRKYLLHDTGDRQSIDYQDDVDFFIIDDAVRPGRLAGKHKGVYFHKNEADAVRQVTHRDYAMVVPYVVGYAEQVAAGLGLAANTLDAQTLKIRLHIRKSGYQRALVFENNRIKELIKLSNTQQVNAMLGIDSTVPNWRADVLEASAYPKIMGSKSSEITAQLVQTAYGYNAISKISADSPIKTVLSSGQRVVNIPYGLQNGATVYEYDAAGKMLGWHKHNYGPVYGCVSQLCTMAEVFAGTGTAVLDEIYGNTQVPLKTLQSYRVYQTTKAGNVVADNWRDITGDNNYLVTDNVLSWAYSASDLQTLYHMVRMDDTFYAKDISINVIRGLLTYTITSDQNRFGSVGTQKMTVPMGELDIFLNDKPLINGVDYIIDFPTVVIFNKEYLVDPENTPQRVHTRFFGFCTKQLAMSVVEDHGFIQHGFLSNNYVYNLRDDRVIKLVSDGGVRHRDDLEFSEDHAGVSITNALNGRPYAIRDVIVPMRGLTPGDTYVLKAASEVIDAAVEDYLTLKIPQPPRNGPNAILAKYVVYSPFICRILNDLTEGILSASIMGTRYTDMQIVALCDPYNYLLEFDPIKTENALDPNFVIIHPHNLNRVVDVDLYQYQFMEAVVRLYANGLVSLSNFLRLQPTA